MSRTEVIFAVDVSPSVTATYTKPVRRYLRTDNYNENENENDLAIPYYTVDVCTSGIIRFAFCTGVPGIVSWIVSPVDGTTTLSDLPPYGVFETPLTNLRGVVLRWLRTRKGQRREAFVLLVAKGRTIRKRIRAGLVVITRSVHFGINSSTRPYTDCSPLYPRVWGRSAAVIASPQPRIRNWRSVFPSNYNAVFA